MKMINMTHPILLIDLGYALFYRYSATQLWYKHSHPEEKDELVKDYKWHKNEVFIDKMKKMFVTDIINLAKKYNTPMSNVIIAEDCRLKDNWRVPQFVAYKAQRAEERDKNGWQGGPAFEVIIKEVIPSMINNYNIHHLRHPKIEADDIIAQIVIKGNSDNNNPMKYIIVASDNDYFQLLNDNVDLINMKGVNQKEKMKYSPKGHLIEKILKGDVSDNIGSCMFNKKWTQDLVKGVPKKTTVEGNLFIKTNKKILEYYIENPEQLEIDIKNVTCQGDEYIKGYENNKRLIDFTYLPTEYVEDVHKMYEKIIS
jgi:5'-3' exonuclease